MTLDGALASNEALGIVLVAVLLLVAARNRPYLREFFDDSSQWWRTEKKCAVLSLGVFIAWTTLFDNWRQLTGVPFRSIQQFPSQKVEFEPPPADVRTVTYVLLAISVVLMAAAFSRSIGGYGLQIALGLISFAAWLPLFVFRQRLGISLALGTGERTTYGILGFLTFLLVAWTFDIVLIVTSYTTLVMVAALPITLVLDVLRIRKPKVDRSATGYFGAIGQQARGNAPPNRLDGSREVGPKRRPTATSLRRRL